MFKWTQSLSNASTVWVKKIPPEVFWHFFPNGREFLVQILRTYYRFLSMLEYKFLFNCLQLWRSYAILSATTEFGRTDVYVILYSVQCICIALDRQWLELAFVRRVLRYENSHERVGDRLWYIRVPSSSHDGMMLTEVGNYTTAGGANKQCNVDGQSCLRAAYI